MKKSILSPRFFNRETSWLAFNQRVLDAGCDTHLPLLERLKFLAITASNLDEFFMVRVGGLKLLVAGQIRRRDLTGLTPRQQLEQVTRRVRQMVAEQYTLYRTLVFELAVKGFHLPESLAGLSAEQQAWVARDFDEHIFPLLSPVALAGERPYRPAGLLLHCAVRLAPTQEGGAHRFALVPLGPLVPRFLRAPHPTGAVFVPVEQLVAQQIGRFFGGEQVLECVPFRMTRNADIELREDLSPDLLAGMQELLEDRRETACIRLEIHRSASRLLVNALASHLQVDLSDLYPVDGPIELRALLPLAQAEGFDALRDAPWLPVPSPAVNIKEPLFPQIAERDILLLHPYEAFDPVIRFLEEAADDPSVLAIKQVLYRTARDSAIIEALVRAALAGKHVTVLIELRARFDEARNIGQARRLEQAGAQVVYGVRGLKTHAKICLVVRRERQGIVRYVHFGTGNYNERTALLYSDVGLFTCAPDFGADASDFFNAVTGASEPQALRRLAMAPFTLRTALLRLITDETARAANREKAQIILKMNALTDETLIEALYAASRAGVRVRLNIRGTCCLRPGVNGLSEHIEVVSIIDRFLEHARLFSFYNGGHERLFISSADGMQRNLDKRVELMVPILCPVARSRLQKILKTYFKDTVQAHRLLPDGTYRRCRPSGKTPPCRSQRVLFDEAQTASTRLTQTKPTRLEPYRRNQPLRG
ncbi:MAG: polyphosphate kinase 1 [Lentisphaerae bacterium]|nr:polyphosphate kinase 1 [Lentisphaerota bacterium]